MTTSETLRSRRGFLATVALATGTLGVLTVVERRHGVDIRQITDADHGATHSAIAERRMCRFVTRPPLRSRLRL